MTDTPPEAAALDLERLAAEEVDFLAMLTEGRLDSRDLGLIAGMVRRAIPELRAARQHAEPQGSRVISDEEAKLAHPEADRRRSLPIYRLLQEADQLLHEAMEGGPHQGAAAALHQRLHDAAYTFVTSTNIPEDPSTPMKAWVDFDANYNERLAQGSRAGGAPDAEMRRIVKMLRKSIVDLEDRRMAVENLEALEAALAARPDQEAGRTGEIIKLIDDYFAPWGSWKTAWWEGEVSDDKEFSGDNLLQEIRRRLER